MTRASAAPRAARQRGRTRPAGARRGYRRGRWRGWGAAGAQRRTVAPRGMPARSRARSARAKGVHGARGRWPGRTEASPRRAEPPAAGCARAVPLALGQRAPEGAAPMRAPGKRSAAGQAPPKDGARSMGAAAPSGDGGGIKHARGRAQGRAQRCGARVVREAARGTARAVRRGARKGAHALAGSRAHPTPLRQRCGARAGRPAPGVRVAARRRGRSVSGTVSTGRGADLRRAVSARSPRGTVARCGRCLGRPLRGADPYSRAKRGDVSIGIWCYVGANRGRFRVKYSQGGGQAR